MQFLMSASDSHFSNTLVDGSHLISIDFGRALGIPSPFPLMQLRCSFFEFPQMKFSLLEEDSFRFENDLIPWLAEFTEGIEQYEERRSVRPFILKSIDHLRKNLITVRLGMDWGLTPVELCRLKYPPIDLDDHFQLEEAFKSVNKKDLYSIDIRAAEVRQAMNHTKIFSKAPFLRAYMIAGGDDDLFEYLMEREIEKLMELDEDDLFTEIQIGWLIRASLLLPVEMKPFF
jgi:integrase